jgi:hypothetical protein
MYKPSFYPHEIDNSARLVTGDIFTRTPSSNSDADTFTWSAWVKLTFASSSFGVGGAFFVSSGAASNREFLIYLDATTQRLNVYQWTGGSGGSIAFQLVTSRKFRDTSSWYHIVVAYDSHQATAADRIKIYVNGEQETDFDTANYPVQNLGCRMGTTDTQDMGKNAYNQGLMSDFYITEVNYISGSQLAPTSFGEFKSDTWIPKKYKGGYGSHDYYLDFATRATDPIDASGNGNNWSSTNVASYDWMLDSPTNNWSTLNPLAQFGSPPISEDNLKVEQADGSDGVFASIQPTGDKYYWEVLLSSGIQGYGVMANSGNAYGPINTLYYTDGRIYEDNTLVTSSATTATSGDIIGIEYDPTAETIKFFKNNTQIGSTYDATGDGLLPITTGTGAGSGVSIFNFGQESSFAGNKTAQGNTDANGIGDFYYEPPEGCLALCSKNLPDPSAFINPALGKGPQDYFNTVLYTGNNATTQSIDVGLIPDFVWIKSRTSSTGHHSLVDRVRGDVALNSNQRIAEYGVGNFNMNTNNTIDVPYFANDYSMNTSGNSYVAWNWKAGGSGVSNTGGTITSTVSANTDAGISIVTYTGNGSASATVGHGLGVTPAMVITKCRSNGSDEGEWTTAHQGISGQVVFLNQTLQSYNPAVFSTGGVALGNSSAFSFINGTTSVENSNKSGNTYVAYCFAEVEGFSKFGTYTGNGSADGPFISTGFRPAFVIVKNASAADSWFINDNKRNSYNVVDSQLFANNGDPEADSRGLDFLSNGFKIRDNSTSHNGNGNTILYMAFAEMPFKYANAR